MLPDFQDSATTTHTVQTAEFPDDWEPNMRANLVFLIQEGRVLLIHKKTGLGAGKINGPGGKLEAGETAEQAARREVQEELHLTVGSLEEMGDLHFDFVDGLRLHCVVFTGSEFEGVPEETREAKPEWFPIDEVPYDRMWADDAHWLPQVLRGQKFRAWFHFDGEDMLTKRVEWRAAGGSGGGATAGSAVGRRWGSAVEDR